MKRNLIICISAATVMLSGCAYNRTVDHTYNPETLGYDKTTYVGLYFFNKAATTGLTVGKRTKTETTTLSVKSHSTEAQVDAIEKIVEGAVRGAVKGAIPVP